MAARPRLKIGDIVAIRTSNGWAYAQYMLDKNKKAHSRWGSLVRILPGTFSDRLKDFQQLVVQEGLDRSAFQQPQPEKTAPVTQAVQLFENDAAWDAWDDMKENGLRYIRKSVGELKKMALRGDLDREPANAVLAIAAVCLAQHGVVLREARQQGMDKEVLDACRGQISRKVHSDLVWLVELVREQSEVRDFWKEEGLLDDWSRKVGTLRRRLAGLHVA